ncbi:MAG: DUF4349 domain-containing protein [Anaerolineae bacterium]|nr:DUF4349 domain-containing protein [Candidatus Roseilinea sp.]MDW8451687.1 DUF4349 domain-containing protein [Anaerolineae bacterium]
MTITLKYRLALVTLFGSIAIAASACAAPAAPPYISEFTSMAAPTAAPAMPESAGRAPVQPAGEAADQSVQQRLIIRTAELTIVVKDTQEQMSALAKLAEEFGGFVVSSSASRVQDDALQGYITLRVDATRFDEAMNRIRALAVEVRSESVRGEDVTAEYVDLDARLRNLEATEAQLQKILEQATTTEDVLAVYRELTQIREQIEQIKGRMKYLSQSAALATISVTLIPDALAQPIQVGGWRPEGVAKSAVEALIATLQGLASLLIWLVIVVLPVLLILAAPISLIVLLIRRARRNKGVEAAKTS